MGAFFFPELGIGTIVGCASVMMDGMFAAATEAVWKPEYRQIKAVEKVNI
ncbi:MULTISPECIES: hypothetical protein [Bacillus cereus group]|nr:MULTISPECIES: hypothetical protein [Bacillus cereus group]MEB8805490.1 hypothetical protein [Bacillus cereus]WIK99291.1 hypothetical protein QPL86_30715 [Bacillus bombysepticus]